MSVIGISGNDFHEEVVFFGKVRLSDAIARSGAAFSMPCSGNRICGKCKVRISGRVSPIEPQETDYLTEQEKAEGIRLACFTYAVGDCQVTLDSAFYRTQVLTDTGSSEVTSDGRYAQGIGAAVDIGTTTVAVYLYELRNAKRLSIVSGMNAQSRFGADVISRIQYSMEQGIQPLRTALGEQLCTLVSQALAQAGRDQSEMREMVITGNTTMLHTLTGLDPSGIASAPFTPQSLFGESIPLPQEFTGFPERLRIYLPACISAYVGADITCAILATGLTGHERTLLVDVGTNGEMAYYAGGELVCCSTAAGPAFEGAGLYQGMTATEGAISEVFVRDGGIGYKVIGGAPAKGICGSGIVDAIAVLCELGIIDETGRMEEEEHDYLHLMTEVLGQPAVRLGESGVVVTQEDVRKLQLAKSAVAAGIDTLLHEAGCTPDQVQCFYLAGGFGSYIRKESAARIGLFPKELVGKLKVAGNAAGAGASMMLCDASLQTQGKETAQAAREISLSGHPFFMERYIENMMFEG